MNNSLGHLLDPEQLRLVAKDLRRVIATVETANDDDQIQNFRTTVDSVIFTSRQSTLDAAHRVAAWNTLSTVVDQSIASKSIQVRSYVWVGKLWSHAFDIYVAHAAIARPKSIRQLLTTLTSALGKGSDDANSQREHAMEVILGTILDLEDARQAKIGAPFLSHLLAKNIVSIDQVLTKVSQLEKHQTDSSSAIHDLLWALFQWLGKGDFGSSVAQLVSNILDQFDQNRSTQANHEPVWSLPLKRCSDLGVINIDGLRAHALPMLFKRSFKDFTSFLYSHGLSQLSKPQSNESFADGLDHGNEQMLCIALQTGNDLGLIGEEEVENIQDTSKMLILPVQWIGRLLLRESRIVRLTGLCLLINSHSRTRPFSKTNLLILRKCMPNFFADSDADFRSELFGLFQRLIDRLRSITATQARLIKTEMVKDDRSNDSKSILSGHRNFLEWIVRFLTWELRPTASYQRHISCLKCLTILLRSGLDSDVRPTGLSKSALGEVQWPFKMHIMSNGLRDLLITSLLDPFDDVRISSANILSLFTSESHSRSWHSTMNTALNRAADLMLSSGRADQADGVAHLWALKHRIDTMTPDSALSTIDSLVIKLREMIDIARTDLAEAINDYPMHGMLTSLRYVIAQDDDSLKQADYLRLSSMLGEVWTIVKPTLCNDAPEGYLPTDVDAVSGSTKEILSYCWRALKEASLVINALVLSTQADSNTINELCRLTFEQLVELRHRGAFSTVAQTWVTCCTQSRRLEPTSGGRVVNEWYSSVIEMLEKNIKINSRRSAGLPSLLCGILINDHSGEMLRQAISDLTRVARSPVDKALAEDGTLSQVHAMNCIKDILKNTRLGEQSEKYIPTCLQLAADALHSDVWAIRNCGLMLFRAVTDRLLGTSDSHYVNDWTVQRRLSSAQYPELLEVTLGLLTSSVSGTTSTSVEHHEGLFPALQLLQYTNVPGSRLAEVYQALVTLMASPSWHVRDKAARTYTILADLHIIWFSSLLQQSGASENLTHGCLLAAKYFLQRVNYTQERSDISRGTEGQEVLVKEAWNSAIVHYSMYIDGRSCPVVKAAYIDVMREALLLLASSCKDVHELELHTHGLQEDQDGHASFSIPTIRQNLYRWSNEIGAAVTLQALARLFAVQLVVVPDFHQIQKESAMELVKSFTAIDEDACLHLVKQLERTLYLTNSDSLEIVRRICKIILSSDSNSELMISAQELLLSLTKINQSAALFSETPSQDFSVLASSPNLDQHFADGWLQLETARLESSIASTTSPTEAILTREVISWAKECTAAVTETGIFTREAATRSLDRASQLWHVLSSLPDADPQFRDVCLSVYDLLNDDDEDIRITSAHITRRILQTRGESSELDFEPIAATQKLLSFCIIRWQTSEAFLAKAVFRAFGIDESGAEKVSSQLADCLKTDTALFVQEKQNLYIDDLSEVKVWSQTIMKLPLAMMSTDLLGRLAEWVVDGLDVLAAHAKTSHDGGLGWSTKSEAFVLGMRVIYGTEVLLWRVKRGLRVPVRPSDLRLKLAVFHGACEAAGVNCLWRWEVERVLGDSICFRVRKVAEVVNGAHQT